MPGHQNVLTMPLIRVAGTFPFVCSARPDRGNGTGSRSAGARFPIGPSRPGKNTAPRRPRPRNPNGHQGQQARIQRNRVMDKASVFVGIDVAKHRLEVHLRPSGESFTINHGEEEVAALVERLGALEPALIVLEATGGLEVRLAAALAAASLPVAVVNPRQVRAFVRATGRLAKTDRLDAKAIAHFAEAVRPPMRPFAGRGDPPPASPGGSPA